MATTPSQSPNLILFEDDHLLVVNKPAGWNTHAPSPFAGEGIYDWLRHREPRWASLAIIQRLDKETSGVMVFAKSLEANRSLTEQFTQRVVQKSYLLVTDRPVPRREQRIVSTLVRAGERYLSRPLHGDGPRAETVFRVVGKSGDATTLEAEPLTGRTHQIRVHAAELGFPILGDSLYGGTPAKRVFLHAAELRFKHPVTAADRHFEAPANFEAEPRLALRQSLFDPALTNAFRLIHGAADGWPGWYVDRLGPFLLSQSSDTLKPRQSNHLQQLMRDLTPPVTGVYHKVLSRQVRQITPAESSPQLVLGEAAPGEFQITENGVCFQLSFNEGYSVGLFLDQRDNRRRFLNHHVAAGFPLFARSGSLRPGTGQTVLRAGPEARAPEVLNVFAYTCGFSVCAACAGARTTSLDLSKKYLEWGRRNFALNGFASDGHDFIYGDALDWMRRLVKKGRAFDAVILDPPTFSQSKEGGVFRVEKDYGRLVAAALPVLKSKGVLFASTNAATNTPEDFLATIETAVQAGRRRVMQRHYVPQPTDFPISREGPAYLKTAWYRIG